jgi:hypothetical protein
VRVAMKKTIPMRWRYNDGVAVFLGPGGVPVIFDHEGVSEVIGDLSGRGAEA